jgi:uncharacterized protein DUF402
VWHFWDGPERTFAGWYLNLQRPFRRTPIGYDTQDLELDVWIPAAGQWTFKDEDKLEERQADGRFTEAEVAEIRSIGSGIAGMLDRREHWWDETWTRFEPDPSWPPPSFPAGWDGAGPEPLIA